MATGVRQSRDRQVTALVHAERNEIPQLWDLNFRDRISRPMAKRWPIGHGSEIGW